MNSTVMTNLQLQPANLGAQRSRRQYDTSRSPPRAQLTLDSAGRLQRTATTILCVAMRATQKMPTAADWRLFLARRQRREMKTLARNLGLNFEARRRTAKHSHAEHQRAIRRAILYKRFLRSRRRARSARLNQATEQAAADTPHEQAPIVVAARGDDELSQGSQGPQPMDYEPADTGKSHAEATSESLLPALPAALMIIILCQAGAGGIAITKATAITQPNNVQQWSAAQIATCLTAACEGRQPGMPAAQAALDRACRSDKAIALAVVTALLTRTHRRALADYADSEPLMVAVQAGNVEACEVLLSQANHPAWVNAQGHRALREAVSTGHSETSQWPLITVLARYEAEAWGSDSAALLAAVECGRTNIARVLLVAGAGADDMRGEFLQLAARRGDVGMVQLLLEFGARADRANNAALFAAAESGRVDVCEVLFTHPHNLAQAGFWANKLLRIAAARNYVVLGRVLLQLGADAAASNNHASVLEKASGCGHEEFIALLLTWTEGPGVGPANPNFQKGAALKAAVTGGHVGACRVLLTHGANADHDGSYALRLAAAYGYMDVVQLLTQPEYKHRPKNLAAAYSWARRAGHAPIAQLIGAMEAFQQVPPHGLVAADAKKLPWE